MFIYLSHIWGFFVLIFKKCYFGKSAYLSNLNNLTLVVVRFGSKSNSKRQPRLTVFLSSALAFISV